VSRPPESSVSRLRAANPVREADVPSADSPNARALEERIVRSDPRPAEPAKRRWWTRRRALLVLIPIGIITLGASGFGLYRNVTEPLRIACHGRMAINSSVVPVAGPVDDPAAACAALWHPGADFNRDGSASVPALQPCLVDGAIAVFPLEPNVADACDELHVPQVAAQSDEASAAQALSTALEGAFIGTCMNESDASRLVHSMLEARRMSEWSVVPVRDFTTTYRCATVGVNVAKRQVTLAPVSAPTTP
jgi:hypothetical protein